jgi:ABC-type transporter Mla maintaining outer membrane lipid asymmetry ATPase subunit MlaF
VSIFNPRGSVEVTFEAEFDGESAVEFRDVRNQVRSGLSMSIPTGKITMIMGPSGTGRSVCVSHIRGSMRPDAGDVIVVTHAMLSAPRIADHICSLWQGKLVAAGPAEELFASDDPFVHRFLGGESRGPLGME